MLAVIKVSAQAVCETFVVQFKQAVLAHKKSAIPVYIYIMFRIKRGDVTDGLLCLAPQI